MRRTLFITFLWHITVSLHPFAVLAAPALKWQDPSDRTYASYQISGGVGGTAEVEAGAMISGTSVFLTLCHSPPGSLACGNQNNIFLTEINLCSPVIQH